MHTPTGGQKYTTGMGSSSTATIMDASVAGLTVSRQFRVQLDFYCAAAAESISIPIYY